MKKSFLLLIILAFTNSILKAQVSSAQSQVNVSPFLFSVNTLSANSPKLNFNYSGSYGENTSGPFGYDGLDQQFAVKGYLGHQFTLYANAAIGFAHSGRINSTQQIEVLKDFIGGKKNFGPQLGLGLGVNRDWDGVAAIFSRVAASWNANQWRFGGNMLFEKAFSSLRDKLDFTTSVGFHHRVTGSLFAGFEAVGQDLEGFWEEDEAEGGARLLLGPSLNFAPEKSRFALSVCGGPVFYATRSNVVPSEAIRPINTQNGYSVRAMLSFNFHK